jgi:hypothetical protein
VEASSDGRFFVAWNSRDQDGSLEGIYDRLLHVLGFQR